MPNIKVLTMLTDNLNLKVITKKGKKCKSNSDRYPALFYGPERGGLIKQIRQLTYKRNIEAHSSNHCCSGKARSITCYG